MNSEDKIYNKIKHASQNGEKDFPGMDKVWNRVEEKLDNTIVVKKKNTWQKLAIAASVLLTFSIIYHFVSNEEIIKSKILNKNQENPIIVSNDSAEKIIEKAKEVVVDHDNSIKKTEQITPDLKFNATTVEKNPWATSFAPVSTPVLDSAVKLKYDVKFMEEKEAFPIEMNKSISSENAVGLRNSAINSSNSSNSNNGYVAVSGKKYDTPTKLPKSNYKAKSAKSKVAAADKNEDLVVIDGIVKDKKELDNINTDDVEITHLNKPIYIINGTEYSEESLFGKKPTSPYAPLDKQEIITINVVKAADAMKIYGKKGENGVVIITTKDGKPVKK